MCERYSEPGLVGAGTGAVEEWIHEIPHEPTFVAVVLGRVRFPL